MAKNEVTISEIGLSKLVVKVKLTKRLRFRIWLFKTLIVLACKMLNAESEIEVDCGGKERMDSPEG